MSDAFQGQFCIALQKFLKRTFHGGLTKTDLGQVQKYIFHHRHSDADPKNTARTPVNVVSHCQSYADGNGRKMDMHGHI